ncbi:MAG: hypothetical protein F7B20_07795 [Aeropyrum sp.]|nr:hypothetical protein [Aeropyrum sp.]MCE4616634.1 hypothetical protein [Aeropyrum sp.]
MYKRLRSVIETSLEWARSSSPISLEGEVLVASSPSSYPAARILYVGVAHSGAPARLSRPSEAALTLLPYREFRFTLIAYTLDPKDTRIIHLVEAASSLGAEAIYIVAPPMHPTYEERLVELGASRIVVTGETPLTTMCVASLVWTPKLLGMREERYRGEVLSLASSIDWILERFSAEIESTLGRANSGGSSLKVYTSPLGEPGGEYLYLAGAASPPLPLEAIAYEGRSVEPIAFMTSAEEPSYRDVLRTASVRGVRPIVFNVNTDPITAGFYTTMIASIISNRIL